MLKEQRIDCVDLAHRHVLDGVPLYALHGHLDGRSSAAAKVGARVRRGEVIGRMGPEAENGGWPPHLHFQLSLDAPPTHDMPGAVTERDRRAALWTYPDPRFVLGPLY